MRATDLAEHRCMTRHSTEKSPPPAFCWRAERKSTLRKRSRVPRHCMLRRLSGARTWSRCCSRRAPIRIFAARMARARCTPLWQAETRALRIESAHVAGGIWVRCSVNRVEGRRMSYRYRLEDLRSRSITMATRFRRSIWLVRTMGVTMTWTLLLGGIEIRAAAPSFCAAYIHPVDDGPLLTLFPMVGPKVTVPLPAGLPRDFRLMATSLDGKAIYGQASDQVGPSDAIIKIDFKPTRHSLVQGSVGLGTIWYLSISQQSDRICASGWSKRQGMAECGAFEIDTGTLRNLRVGLHPDCGGAAGDISPD